MDNRWRPLALSLLVTAVAAGAPCFAQQPPPADVQPPPAQPLPAEPAPVARSPGVAWSNLSPEQQRLLSNFGGQWNTLPAERQQALARGSERWLDMSEDQRDQATRHGGPSQVSPSREPSRARRRSSA